MDVDKVIFLMEMIFQKFTYTPEMQARGQSIPKCLETEEFSRNLDIVMTVREVVVHSRMSIEVNELLKAKCEDESYVTAVMVACFVDKLYNQSIIKCFLDVCAVVKHLSNKTLREFGVDFSDLNPDIFLVFYKNEIKEKFEKCGGFQKLYDHIRKHKYLKWRWTNIDLGSLDNPSEPVNASVMDLDRKLKKEIEIENTLPTALIFDTGNRNRIPHSVLLARKVLSSTRVKLPICRSEPDKIMKPVETQRHEIAAKDEKKIRLETDAEHDTSEIALQECSSSNSNSATNHDTNQQEDFARYESIIQAVIRHNRSKRLNAINCDNPNNELDGILSGLKKNIESLIEVLDNFDEE